MRAVHALLRRYPNGLPADAGAVTLPRPQAAPCIPISVIRLLLELRLLNACDVDALLRVHRGLREGIASANAIWRCVLPRQLVASATESGELIRALRLVAYPVALAVECAQIICLGRPERPGLSDDCSRWRGHYLEHALVLALFLHLPEVEFWWPPPAWMEVVFSRDVLSSMLGNKWTRYELRNITTARDTPHALALYRQKVSVHLQVPLSGITDLASFERNYFQNVCASSVIWQQMIYARMEPRARFARHCAMLSLMFQTISAPGVSQKLFELIVRYFASANVPGVRGVVFGVNTPLRVVELCDGRDVSLRKAGAISSWTRSDLRWAMENRSSLPSSAVSSIMSSVPTDVRCMEAFRVSAGALAAFVDCTRQTANFVDDDGVMPIGVAPSVEVLQYAGEHWSDMNWGITNSRGETALFYAPVDYLVLSFLLNRGLNMNACSANGETAFQRWLGICLDRYATLSDGDSIARWLPLLVDDHGPVVWAPSRGRDLFSFCSPVLRALSSYNVGRVLELFSRLKFPWRAASIQAFVLALAESLEPGAIHWYPPLGTRIEEKLDPRASVEVLEMLSRCSESQRSSWNGIFARYSSWFVQDAER